MAFLVIGVNHRTAPISLLEKVAFTPDKLTDGLLNAHKIESVKEVVILSTCNRTEIYCRGSTCPRDIIHWLAQFHSMTVNDLTAYFYCYQSDFAVRHIMRVAAGLDSLVIGEPQILGQIKTCFMKAEQLGTTSNKLKQLFTAAIEAAKLIRTHTAIGKNSVSIAYAAVALAKQIFEDLSQKTALLIGSGETATLVAKYLQNRQIGNIYVASRTLSNATHLSQMLSAKLVSLNEITDILPYCDLIVTATASPAPLLTKNDFTDAIKIRKHAPIFVVDLAMPRDIEPTVDSLADVYYYTIDDLRDVVKNNLGRRKEAAILAEEMINVRVKLFKKELEAVHSVDLIRAYRNQAENIRKKALRKALKNMTLGADPAEILEKFSKNLSNQLIHAPCAQIRSLDGDKLQEKLAWTSELFNLE